MTKTTYADQSFTQTAYDAAGRVSSSTDANGNKTRYGYDAAGAAPPSPTRSPT